MIFKHSKIMCYTFLRRPEFEIGHHHLLNDDWFPVEFPIIWMPENMNWFFRQQMEGNPLNAWNMVYYFEAGDFREDKCLQVFKTDVNRSSRHLIVLRRLPLFDLLTQITKVEVTNGSWKVSLSSSRTFVYLLIIQKVTRLTNSAKGKHLKLHSFLNEFLGGAARQMSQESSRDG